MNEWSSPECVIAEVLFDGAGSGARFGADAVGSDATVGTSDATADRSTPIRVYASRPETAASLAGFSLFRFDCVGRVVASAAEAWRADETGRVWSFRGTGLASEAVEDALKDLFEGQDVDDRDFKNPALENHVDSVVVRDGIIDVFLGVSARHLPRLLGRPGAATPATANAPSQRFVGLVPKPRDERDLVDDGVEVFVTHEPNVVDYASRSNAASVAALPWNRVYTLASPTQIAIGVGALGSIANEAIRGESRPGSGEIATCAFDAVDGLVDASAARPSADGARNATREVANDASSLRPAVVFAEEDEVARDIAARVVSLASQVTAEQRLVAEGVSAAQLSQRVASGDDRYYVVAGNRYLGTPCRTLARLGAGWVLRGQVVPVVEVRDHVVVATNAGSTTLVFRVVLDDAGLPWIEPVGSGR